MRTCFNDGWSFFKVAADDFEAPVFVGDYNPVALPHDWLIYDSHHLYESSYGHYKKKYDFGKIEGKRFRLYFEGVYMDSTIFVNGTAIFDWKYGYSSFEVDLTEHLKDGENEILVLVRHLSPNSRWYSGAGIYRDVWLLETPVSCIDTDSIYLHSDKTGDTSYHCSFSGELIGATDDLLVNVCLSGEQGVLFEQNLPATAKITTSFDLYDLTKDHIWDIAHPNRLWISLTLYDAAGTVYDQVTKTTGLRSFEYRPDAGFFLNGRKVKIHGVCLHHDLGCLGAAFHKEAARRQLHKMKQMGVNAIRTSHNMPAPEFMELCDEMGLLVDSEAFDMWERPKTPYDYARFFDDWYEKDVKSWICRDRNHPSVIMWSIGNEIYDTHVSSRGAEVTKMLHDAVRRHDPLCNAPTTIGSNYMPWEGAQNCADIVDLAGYNYGERLYEEHHKAHPDWCIYGSETTSGVKSRGIYHFPREAAYMTHADLQCSVLGNCRAGVSAPTASDIIVLDRDSAISAGMFIWTGIDYIGEPSPYSTKNAYFGNVDTAVLEKDSFYLYQAAWTTEPVLHLFPYWDFNIGQIIDVVAYTNLSSLELFLNGHSLGSCEVRDYTASWKVSYFPGELKVVGYTEDGTEISDVRNSFGDSVAILLTPEQTSLRATGEDIMALQITTIDQYGRDVTNARDRISLRVFGGRLLGFDNGDSTDYDSYKSNSRRLFSGRAVAYIAAPTDPNELIVVNAYAAGLKHSTVIIPLMPDRVRPGICMTENVPYEVMETEIPLRKISLSRSTGPLLTPKQPSCQLRATLNPIDTSYVDVHWCVVTNSGIETKIAKITVNETDPKKATLTALGDGSFRLRCYSYNGKSQPEIISEYEFEATGFGPASFDPYEFIPGCLYNDSIAVMDEVQEGGVNIKPTNNLVGFKKTDFGSTGSDRFTLRVINWHRDDPFNFKLWLGNPQDPSSKCLGQFTYQADFEWQTYKDNHYTLSERIRGEQDLYFEFDKNDMRIDFGGFSFAPINKAYDVIDAASYDVILGDTFTVTETAIQNIGNNVFITYDGMNFTKGTSKIRITGRTHHDQDTIHVHFTLDGRLAAEEIVEFPGSLDIITVEHPLPNLSGRGMVELIFLPGCDFDLVSFEIIPE